SIICGLGLLTFGLSDFVPTARFAWMMLAFLMLALIGDLLLLPALLISPLGRCFQWQIKRGPTQEIHPPHFSKIESARTSREAAVECRIDGTT
ncbi:MAG: hypothetical protein KDA84_17990, partial [Planctomycetaceae bacterium]|nr:hypothetical protein [Planctomycetaceae bacterium]